MNQDIRSINLRIPETIKARGHTFTIDKKELGRGATGIVHAAQDEEGKPVVIKFLRDEKDRPAFRREAQVLTAWLRQDEKIGRFIPRLYNDPEDREFDYLIMERIFGREVTKLLADRSALEEGLVVQIGAQFAQVLATLHDKLERTFTDLKLENVWWLSDQSHIKVTDWNVISENQDLRGISRDLSRWAAMLFQMVTGKSLESSGKPVEQGFALAELARWGGEPWLKVSLGFQDVIARALHPYRAFSSGGSEPQYPRRYQTARELAEDLTLLERAWNNSIDEPVLQVQQLLYSKGDTRRARWVLEIIVRRPTQPGKEEQMVAEARELLEELRHRTEEEGAFGKIASLLRGKGADKAEGIAQELIEQGNEPLTGHRLLAVAQIARSLDESTLEKVIGREGVGGILALIQQGNAKDALSLLTTLALRTQGAAREAVTLLEHDLRFNEAMRAGLRALEEENLNAADLHFRDAAKRLTNLHDARAAYELPLIEAVGAPEPMLGVVSQRLKEKSDREITNDALTRRDVKALHQVLLRTPENNALHRAVFEEGTRSLARGDLERANGYVALVPLCSSPPARLRALQQSVAALNAAEAAVRVPEAQVDTVLGHLARAREWGEEEPTLHAALPGVIGSLFVDLLPLMSAWITRLDSLDQLELILGDLRARSQSLGVASVPGVGQKLASLEQRRVELRDDKHRQEIQRGEELKQLIAKNEALRQENEALVRRLEELVQQQEELARRAKATVRQAFEQRLLRIRWLTELVRPIPEAENRVSERDEEGFVLDGPSLDGQFAMNQTVATESGARHDGTEQVPHVAEYRSVQDEQVVPSSKENDDSMPSGVAPEGEMGTTLGYESTSRTDGDVRAGDSAVEGVDR
jgi:hypothetical protein